MHREGEVLQQAVGQQSQQAATQKAALQKAALQQADGQAAVQKAALQQAYKQASLPNVGQWSDLKPGEREYREQVLDDIARRVAAEGPRVATSSPDRGRQFLPFAAMKEQQGQ